MELFRSPRILVERFGILQGLDGTSSHIDGYPAIGIQHPCSKCEKQSVQSDVTLERGRHCQATGDAQLLSNPFPAASQTTVMHGAERHANLTPVILKLMKGGGNQIVRKAEIICRF